MKAHEKFADDLTLYALNELAGEERLAIEQHLQTCASCRRELEMLRSDLGLLGLSSSGPQPPARSRQRLMRTIAAEPRGVSLEQPLPAPKKSWWQEVMPALAILGLVFIVMSLWRTDIRRKDEETGLVTHNQEQAAQLDHLNQELRLLTSPDAVHVSLNPQKSPRQPSGTAIFSPSQKRMMFMASNMPAVPQGKAYELWIIPTTGAPIPAGVFKPDGHGNAVMMDHTMPSGVEAKAFAITLEKEEGSDKPTSPILLMGLVS